MKKIVTIVLAVLLCLSCLPPLAACKQKVGKPQNIREENGVLTWDEVSGVDGYMFAFNGNRKTRFFVKTNLYDLSSPTDEMLPFLTSGINNSVEICAVTFKSDTPTTSEWTKEHIFFYVRKMPAASLVAFDETRGVLSWRKTRDLTAEVKYYFSVMSAGTTSEIELPSSSITLAGSQVSPKYECDVREAFAGTQYGGTVQFALVIGKEGYDKSDPSEYFSFDLADGSGGVVDPSAPKLTSITATWSGGVVNTGNYVDKSHITVTAKYENNSSKIVTTYTLTDFDTSTAGRKTVTVRYTENGVSKETTFSIDVVSAVNEIYLDASRLVWFENDSPAVYLYVWYEGGGENRTFPGVKMTKHGNRYVATFDPDKTVAGILFTRRNPSTNEEWNRIELKAENGTLNFNVALNCYTVDPSPREEITPENHSLLIGGVWTTK